MALVQEAEEFVEATPLRMKLGGAAKMPFADEGRGVAGFAQPIGDRLLRDGQTNTGRGVLRSDGVKLKTEARLVTPRQQRRARGRAERRRHVTIRKAHPTGCQRIQVRRRNVAPAVAAEFTVAEIVGDDVNDIGSSRRSGAVKCGQRQQQQRGETGEPKAVRSVE